MYQLRIPNEFGIGFGIEDARRSMHFQQSIYTQY